MSILKHHISAKTYTFLFNGRDKKNKITNLMSYIELDLKRRKIIEQKQSNIDGLFCSDVIDIDIDKELNTSFLSKFENKIDLSLKQKNDLSKNAYKIFGNNPNEVHLLSFLQKENRERDFTNLLVFYLWQEAINLEDFKKIEQHIDFKNMNVINFFNTFKKFSYKNKRLFKSFKEHFEKSELLDILKLNIKQKRFKTQKDYLSFVYNPFWNYKFSNNLKNCSIVTEINDISISKGLHNYLIIDIDLKEKILYPQSLCFAGYKVCNKMSLWEKFKYEGFLKILSLSYIVMEGPFSYSVMINKKLYNKTYKKELEIKEEHMQEFRKFLENQFVDFLNEPTIGDLLVSDENKEKVLSSLLENNFKLNKI